jgi:hypothetical protein
MHEGCSLEEDIGSKLHRIDVSKESFSSPLRNLGSELMLYSGIMMSKRLRIVGNHGTSRIPRALSGPLCPVWGEWRMECECTCRCMSLGKFLFSSTNV